MAISMDRWKGQVAVVTGAGSGIGAAIAVQLVDAGVKVAGLDINLENVEKLAKQLQGKSGTLLARHVDVTKEVSILDAFDWVKSNLGPVHILVNSAGVVKKASIIDGDTEVWKAVMDTNLLGVAIACREAVRQMRANNVDGHLILINSVLGHRVVHFADSNMYTPAKFGLTALGEVLHNELNEAKTKIKVSSISPGFTKTCIRDDTNAISSGTAEAISTYPMVNPEDIAGGVMYALSTPPHVQVHELTIKHVNEFV